jgi:hypothetical protein
VAAPAFDPAQWSEFLSETLERPVVVSFGRARRRVLVARARRGELCVRLNAVFAAAPPDVRAATASFLGAGAGVRAGGRRLDAWIESMAEHIQDASQRRTRLRARGQAHDLTELQKELCADEFAGNSFPAGPPRVTWGRRSSRAPRRSLRLGSFDPLENVARVHPVLDQPAVPRSFVRYILFHELLHAAMPAVGRADGRTAHHPPEFVRRERAYRGYDEAIAWQNANITALLRSARTGRPLPLPRRALATRLVQRLLYGEGGESDESLSGSDRRRAGRARACP